MASLSLQNFSTMVEGMAAAVQGSSKKLLNLTVGSVLRAVLESTASLGLWLQYLILQVLQATRLSTSTGTDVDSFVNDFGLTRLPAVSATGTVTVSRLTVGQAAFMPIGATMMTADQTQSFAVTTDATNPAYVAAPVAGYTIGPLVAALTVPVQAVTPGSGGNVLAQTIALISSALPGVDTVTNAAAFTNGADAETDEALKTRFQSYLSTLSKATLGAVGQAVEGVASNLTYALVPNQLPNGASLPGSFVVVVDDGSGDTAAETISLVANAVDAVRALSVTAYVQAASLLAAQISLTITVSSGPKATAQAAVNAALAAFVNALPVGVALPYLRLAQVAFDAAPAVSGVSALLLNGGTSDLTPSCFQVVRARAVVVN